MTLLPHARPLRRRRSAAATPWLAVALAAGLASPAARAGYEDGLAAARRGDYATALREFQPLAERGERGAQVSLGDLYLNGLGIPVDDAAAARWYRQAADQGDSRAQTNLGFLFEQGRGVPRDFEEAARWYRKAADQGEATAQSNLAYMALIGRGLPQDDAQAAHWAALAA